jgi:hypothetical protein
VRLPGGVGGWPAPRVARQESGQRAAALLRGVPRGRLRVSVLLELQLSVFAAMRVSGIAMGGRLLLYLRRPRVWNWLGGQPPRGRGDGLRPGWLSENRAVPQAPVGARGIRAADLLRHPPDAH